MKISVESIEVIPSEHHQPIAVEDIIQALSADEIALSHGEEFTGRPDTTIIANDDYVVKLRKEYRVNRVNALQFCKQAIEKEAAINLYHPAKTWFLFRDDDNELPLIANITPKLRTLHDPELLSSIGEEAYLQIVGTMLQRVLHVAANQDKLLDLGLSNFGLDAQNNLYYVDDDHYVWDNFQLLSQFIGIFLRSQTWLTGAQAHQLGSSLNQSVVKEFHDPHWCTVIMQHLKSLFIPEGIAATLKSLIEGLQNGQTFTFTPKKKSPIMALIADIHGNEPALNAALEFIDKKNIDNILMLGDVVGYGPHPSECIEILQKLDNISMIRGNHDNAVALNKPGNSMNALAKWSHEWSVQQLSAEQREWLGNLPPYLEDENWLAVHGAPMDKSFFNAYVYKLSYIDNLDEMEERKIRWCFHGHTHIPYVYYRAKHTDLESADASQSLKEYQHALICPGSIGQPRNLQPGSQLALINLESEELELHRIPYDLRSTVNDMKKHGFPEQLIARLIKGQ